MYMIEILAALHMIWRQGPYKLVMKLQAESCLEGGIKKQFNLLIQFVEFNDLILTN